MGKAIARGHTRVIDCHGDLQTQMRWSEVSWLLEDEPDERNAQRDFLMYKKVCLFATSGMGT